MKLSRKRRIYWIVALVVLVAIAVGLTLYALRSNINLFFTPSQLAMHEAPLHQTIRVGGVVKKGSLLRDSESLEVTFTITDFAEEVQVRFDDILPDLFREGQGVVIVGQLENYHEVTALQVLAKHDENYMPPEAADALKAAGKFPDGSYQTSYRE